MPKNNSSKPIQLQNDWILFKNFDKQNSTVVVKFAGNNNEFLFNISPPFYDSVVDELSNSSNLTESYLSISKLGKWWINS